MTVQEAEADSLANLIDQLSLEHGIHQTVHADDRG